jgi:threonine/homoserine/homoserine lactone efflux protein
LSANNYFLFLIYTFIMGFLAAIPIGPVQLELVRRSLNGHLASGLVVGLGAVISDTAYGFLAIFGLSHFLLKNDVLAIFLLANSAIITFIGIWIIRTSRRALSIEVIKTNPSQKEITENTSVSFITGFTLAITNPFMMSWWLLGSELLRHIGVINKFSTTDSVLYLIIGGLGLGAYLGLLGYATYKAKKFFSEKGARRISIVFGFALIALAVYFLIKSILLLNS